MHLCITTLSFSRWKKIQKIDNEDITKNFGENVLAIENRKELISEFKSNVLAKPCVLFVMSSGNFYNAKMW